MDEQQYWLIIGDSDLTDSEVNDGLYSDILDDVALVYRCFFIHVEDIIAEWIEDSINYQSLNLIRGF